MFEIKVEGLDKLQNAIRKNPKVVFEELSKGINDAVNIIRPIMRQETPYQKGALSRNIYARASGLTGEVGPNLNITPYAWYVHEGTDPYVIRPTSKKALYWKGAKHPVKKVNHPGIKANPFVERTFERIKTPVEGMFGKKVGNIISRFHNS